MSNDIVIRVENLGKKYRIRHQKPERYTALRDVLTDKLTAPWRSLTSRLRSEAATTNGNGGSASHNFGISPAPPAQEDFWALRDVSFEVKRGEVVGIIGRNGAGKSTLLKILSRITEPTKGRVRIKGRVASLLEVGTGFHPELTGRENIFLNGAILGMTREEIKRKFDEIVAFAEVETFLDTAVKRYSSGMYVRLAFAIAAHLEPEILIVDEILAVGDAEFQRKSLGKMQTVATDDRTVLFVSHNLQAIERICSRGIHLRAGAVICDDRVAHVCQRYIYEAVQLNRQNGFNTAHRNGTGDARITTFEILDADGVRTDRVAAGKAFFVQIHYVVSKTIRLPSFGFALLSAAGVRIFNTTSADLGLEIERFEGSGSALLSIRNITLPVGQYLCNLAISDSTGEYCDYITEFPFLEIIASSVLPKCRTYDQASGVVYADCQWKINQNS
jgi:lipopolysaccharide transport system ATP-binding protein